MLLYHGSKSGFIVLERFFGITQAESICRQFRRDGRYFDEIVGDGALA